MTDNQTRAAAVAAEAANVMRRKLEHATPAELGWPGLTAEELIASEYRCWLGEEHRIALRAQNELMAGSG
jgi:hypothetical protein